MTRPDPTVGILVGGLVLTERRRWPALVLAACGVIAFSGAVHGQLLLHGIGLAAGVGFDACVVAWFVQRTNEPPFDLNRVAHMSTLILAAILVPSAGGILGAAALFLGGAPSFLVTWRAWWLAETLGILLTAPIALAAFPKGTRHLGTLGFWKVFEATITFAGAVVVAEIVFGEVLGPQVLVPAFVIPFLLWPVVRLGPGGTAAMLITVSFIGLWHAVQGQGPFAVVAGAPTILILRSQGASAMVTVSFLLLASVVAERKRITQQYVTLTTELQQALAELKVLRGFIPICAWCHRVRDDAGFWQQIEKYLDARADVTFSHGICPACTTVAQEQLHEPSLSGPEPGLAPRVSEPR